jgi:hypothetical protein
MTTRILSKTILLLTISLGVPSVARPAHAGLHATQGRRHHHRHHERRKEERRREEREHAHDHDGERHGEL